MKKYLGHTVVIAGVFWIQNLCRRIEFVFYDMYVCYVINIRIQFLALIIFFWGGGLLSHKTQELSEKCFYHIISFFRIKH